MKQFFLVMTVTSKDYGVTMKEQYMEWMASKKHIKKELKMIVECAKCETSYDNQTYYSCPKCQLEFDFEFGLQNAKEQKQYREQIKVDIIK